MRLIPLHLFGSLRSPLLVSFESKPGLGSLTYICKPSGVPGAAGGRQRKFNNDRGKYIVGMVCMYRNGVSFESEPGLGSLTYLCKPGGVPGAAGGRRRKRIVIFDASLPVGGGGVPGVVGGRRLLSEQTSLVRAIL